jgi:hypothetical protein
MSWAAIAREFGVTSAEAFAQTYRKEVDRRKAAPYVALLRKAAKS